MKYFVLVVAIILLAGGVFLLQSFVAKKPQEEFVPAPAASTRSFQLSAAPQDAVFYVGYRYSGGMGSMPVLDASGNVQMVDDLAVYVDEEQSKIILEKGNMPSCVSGRPNIQVAANIHLEKKEDTNSSIEDAPMIIYYVAKIDELKNVTIDAKECE